jgi:ferrous iron transport protein A
MQLTFNKEALPIDDPSLPAGGSLVDLRAGQTAVLESLDLSEDLSRRLMELGFFPGGDVVAAGCAPGGNPRVYRVDGSEVALRIETARSIRVRPGSIRAAHGADGRPVGS